VMKVRERSSATTRSVTTAPCPSLSGRFSILRAAQGWRGHAISPRISRHDSMQP
jgi:hypothetical protein